MHQAADERVRWTAADLELLPDNGNRYEIIDGELLVTRAPHWKHQQICLRIGAALDAWSNRTGLGQAAVAPGILFSEADNVIPDVVWASTHRLKALLDAAGHLAGAPELVVEVLSPGAENQRRDRELKLKLYSLRGIQEYWLVDGRVGCVEVYRREGAVLKLTITLLADDTLTSPLLANFACPVGPLFA
ncbi:Uma2 family endonuclease [Gloeobacter morelensis]|uniref:Uma2 family endonuclease n=1 Tax=Gloeobacter morelensis MG652769 TaxID=2781736 RepID=A0ABY3PNF7_9CYAN|nr:Uma2 family endonuclease [Gloeobacter morelensis]UFP95149.1 Uma2 family endonuclease [Gloeobacter morelensis MG652769]